MEVEWKDWFYYDETSPTCLRWKVDVLTGRNYKRVLLEAGSTAGSGKVKSPQVKLNGKCIFVHRVIWELHNGLIPDGMQIDHINGDCLDNKVANLRLATRVLNARNQKKCSTNTSGVTGVCFDSNGNRWMVQWRDLNSKAQKKSFGVAGIGYDEAFKAAVQFRKQQIALLNSDGAGYSERHGT